MKDPRPGRLTFLALVLGACAPTVGRRPQSEEPVPERLKQVGLEVTPVEKYVFPLVGGHLGSAWCQCRKVGTSPHIGQDYINTPGDIFSVAVSDGVVTSVNFTGSACGWEVLFEDSQGATWRYLHLNKPGVNAGDILARGHIIGAHAFYPKAACGTGPHLHLERHTAGLLPGKVTGRACKNGFRTCNYDPVTVLKDKYVIASLSEARQMSSIDKSLHPATKSSPIPSTSPAAPSLPPLAQNKSLSEALPDDSLVTCNAAQPRPETVSGESAAASPAPKDLSAWIDNLQGHVLTQPARAGRTLFLLNPWSINSDTGQTWDDNVCGLQRAKPAESCVVQWELQILLNTGAWVRVLNEQGVRNRKLELAADAAYCLPEGFTPKYRLVATTESGRTLVTEGELQ